MHVCGRLLRRLCVSRPRRISKAPAEENRLDTKAKRVITLSGGQAVSLILSAFLLSVKTGGVTLRLEGTAPGVAEFLISAAFFIHLFVLIQSVLPARDFYGEIKGLETDGLQIIHALRDQDRAD